MKTVEGKWRLRNERIVEIKWNEEQCYHAIIENLGVSGQVLYYDNEGECYRIHKINGSGVVRASFNDHLFQPWDLWDLVELIEGKEEEIEVVKRNSNPIFLNPIDE